MAQDMAPRPISIVIPVYHEQARINRTIARVRQIDTGDDCEIIVVDGDPYGGTIGVVEDTDVLTMTSERGRGVQMNAGAEAARGDTLLFLHADTELPERAIARILEVRSDSRFVGGAFGFAYDTDRWLLRLFGRFSTWRCRLTGLPFGDQAIFVDRDYFLRIGKYPELPIMEDLELVRRIRRRGGRLQILKESVLTSPRRIEHEGAAYAAVRTGLLLLLYHLGVAPSRLKRYYPDGLERDRPARPM
jgi:rSAM/selenodomain-associated transferase 2